MSKSKMKKQYSSENGFFANAVIVSCIVSFFLFLFFLAFVIFYSEKHWLLNQSYQSYMLAFLFFTVGVGFFFPTDSKKKIEKVIRMIIGIFIIFMSLFTFIDGTTLLLDKKAFEEENYEIIVGDPGDRELSGGDKGTPTKVSYIYVNDIRLDAEKIGLLPDEYEELWVGKEIRFYYLPHSKTIMKWEYVN